MSYLANIRCVWLCFIHAFVPHHLQGTSRDTQTSRFSSPSHEMGVFVCILGISLCAKSCLITEPLAVSLPGIRQASCGVDKRSMPGPYHSSRAVLPPPPTVNKPTYPTSRPKTALTHRRRHLSSAFPPLIPGLGGYLTCGTPRILDLETPKIRHSLSRHL